MTHIEFLTIYAHKFDNEDRLSDDLLHKMSNKASTLWHNGGISTAHVWRLCEPNGDGTYTPDGTTYCFQCVFHTFGVEESYLLHEFEDRGIDDTLSHDIAKLLEIYDRQDKPLNGFAHFTLAVRVSPQTIYGEYKHHYIEYDILGEVDFSRISDIINNPPRPEGEGQGVRAYD